MFDMSTEPISYTTQVEANPKGGLGSGLGVPSRYEIVREVGRGGMGVVFQARHVELGKTVAIKITQPGISDARFRREARILAQVNSPHVVAVHDFDILADGRPMLVLQWIDGSDM